jgi:RHS repeat-associated protein
VADVTFGYDALGRRVKKTASGATKVYVSATQPIAYSPQAGQELAEYVSGVAPTSPTEKYVYGDYIDEPIWKTGTGGAVYYHANSLYCVSALTNGSGAVVERYRYTPYGELTILAADGTTVRSASTYANPYTYTGRRWDSETGLYYYRARYYHPTLGRFIGRDPLAYDGGGQSFYRAYFVPGRRDPSGKKAGKNSGAHAGKICAVPMRDEGTGKPRGTWISEAKIVSDYDDIMEQGAGTIEEVLAYVQGKDCCTLYLIGHQGGDYQNWGGVVSYPTAETTKPNIILPNSVLEAGLKEHFKPPGFFKPPRCNACAINIVACGGATPGDRDAGSPKHKATRKAIARNTGCMVCGSTRNIHIGVRDSLGECAPGITPWPHECEPPPGGGGWKCIGTRPDNGPDGPRLGSCKVYGELPESDEPE